jgi:hypothetical protein
MESAQGNNHNRLVVKKISIQFKGQVTVACFTRINDDRTDGKKEIA